MKPNSTNLKNIHLFFGRFMMGNFSYIQALNRKGHDNVRLVVEQESFPQLEYAPQTPVSNILGTTAESKDEPDVDAFLEKAEQRAKFDEDMWTLHFEEVIITAPRIARNPEPRDGFYLNKSAQYTITRKDIEEFKSSNVSWYLGMIPGIRVEFVLGGFIITSRSPFVPPPKIYIDGMEDVGQEIINTLSVNEIESIDHIDGIGASILGVRGAGGAISITLRRGGDGGPPKFNHTVYTPLGYQKPVEFYSPKYDTLEAKQSNIPDYRTTIFWKPDVVISDDGEASFEFYTSDFRTTYSVVIEGISDDGRMVRQVEKIRVE